MLNKLSKVMMAGIAGLMLMSGLASGAPPVPHQFDVVMTEDIEADLDSSLINVKRKNTNNQIIFQLCTPNCVPFTLGAFWGGQPYANDNDGTECFPPNNSPGDLRSDVQGSIQLVETRNGDAQATFFFGAKADDGEDDFDVKYQLILTDFDGWFGDFPPPSVGNTATMTATGWEMQTEGKGKLRKVACKGMGMNATVIIELTRIP